MSFDPPNQFGNPWVEEPEPENGEWNIMSPEKAWCEFAGALAALTLPESTIIETGMGQGYVTRRLLPLDSTRRLWIHETEQEWIDLIPTDWFAHCRLAVVHGSPPDFLMKRADLVILDSDPPARRQEWDQWLKIGKKGSWVLMHDTYHVDGPPRAMGEWVLQSKLDGLWLNNPRGSFLGVHP